MNLIEDYIEEKSCTYKNEEYLVRDNGAILRKAKTNKPRKMDNVWTFGKANKKTGYMEFAGERVHRIVATAFLGAPKSNEYIVDHIDTNRQNNRAENLRWLTKFENAVFNPLTRQKIEASCGVDIITFLKNPEKYRDNLSDYSISWMRTVSKEEAQNCLQNLMCLTKKNKSKKTGEIGEWVFEDKVITGNYNYMRHGEENNIVKAINNNALQINWKVPSFFPMCPKIIGENPLIDYFNSMQKEMIFVENNIYNGILDDFTLVDNSTILVITKSVQEGTIKPFALAKIEYMDGYFLHYSLGTYFTVEGVYKQYTIAQGLEWQGGDTLDDFC